MSDLNTHILWRNIPGKSYVYLAPADHPSIGYHDDGCRSVSIELAELSAELQAENERLREYEETHKMLRWYLGARGVNSEEAAMASKAALEAFEKAEKVNREKAIRDYEQESD